MHGECWAQRLRRASTGTESGVVCACVCMQASLRLEHGHQSGVPVSRRRARGHVSARVLPPISPRLLATCAALSYTRVCSIRSWYAGRSPTCRAAISSSGPIRRQATGSMDTWTVRAGAGGSVCASTCCSQRAPFLLLLLLSDRPSTLAPYVCLADPTVMACCSMQCRFCHLLAAPHCGRGCGPGDARSERVRLCR
jgi:hypothetical protein